MIILLKSGNEKQNTTVLQGQDRSLNFVQPNYTVRATSVAQPHTSRDPFDFGRSRKLQKLTPDNNSSGYGSLAHLTDSQQNSQLQDDFMNKSEFNSVRGVSHSVTSRARNGPPQSNGAQANGAQEGPRGGFMSLEEECNWILSGREPVMQDGDDYSDDGDEDNTLDDISGDEVCVLCRAVGRSKNPGGGIICPSPG